MAGSVVVNTTEGTQSINDSPLDPRPRAVIGSPTTHHRHRRPRRPPSPCSAAARASAGPAAAGIVPLGIASGRTPPGRAGSVPAPMWPAKLGDPPWLSGASTTSCTPIAITAEFAPGAQFWLAKPGLLRQAHQSVSAPAPPPDDPTHDAWVRSERECPHEPTAIPQTANPGGGSAPLLDFGAGSGGSTSTRPSTCRCRRSSTSPIPRASMSAPIPMSRSMRASSPTT